MTIDIKVDTQIVILKTLSWMQDSLNNMGLISEWTFKIM